MRAVTFAGSVENQHLGLREGWAARGRGTMRDAMRLLARCKWALPPRVAQGLAIGSADRGRTVETLGLRCNKSGTFRVV